MERRNFLNSLFSFSWLLFLKPINSLVNAGSVEQQKNLDTIEKVHLIFKTHLDIGFTDLAENVINRYIDHFIPSALSLSEELRNNDFPERFVWTTGSWLIYEYL